MQSKEDKEFTDNFFKQELMKEENNQEIINEKWFNKLTRKQKRVLFKNNKFSDKVKQMLK